MKIIKKIGVGSHGSVYLVQSQTTGKMYIVKRPNTSEKSQHQAKQEMFALERIKKACKPYLICVKELEIKHGNVEGIYLEYIPNTFELYSYLQENSGELNVYTKFAIMKRLLEGLVVLHSRSVVHRDIKPDNILLEPNLLGTHYIDYGASCIKGNRDCLEEFSGTRDYLSPELVKGANRGDKSWQVCKKADVWALGRTFIDVCFYRVFGDYFWDVVVGGKPSSQLDFDFAENRLLHTIANVTGDKIMDTLVEHTPQTRENEILIPIILLLMNPDWRERPTAEQVLELVNGPLTDALLKLGGRNVEEAALEHAEKTGVSPGTKIFPGPEKERRRTM